MAKKQTSVFICKECGNEYPAWQGQCSFCGEWNTIVEQKVQPVSSSNASPVIASRSANSEPMKLNSIGIDSYTRIDSGIGELNRVLGGGVVSGSLVLISGEPGIGKSTIIIESANKIAMKGKNVLYVSGEESEQQVKLRADRVCGSVADSLYIYPETNLENILSSCENIKPSLLIIDSIQTVYSTEVDSVAGSVGQIRACSNMIMKYAKTANVPVFIVAHVTKSGDLAGPKTIEHMVDCVLNFTGERDKDLRILRSFKNRFGTTDEIGAFKMTADGMMEVSDLSGSLIESDICEEGSVLSASYEGSRAVFFEIQALVSRANVGFARRTSIGIDNNRLNMILAVLEKKAGIRLADYDVYVNVAGGLKPGSPATDLAVALAIVSSFRELSSPARICAVGELGLTGRLRAVHNMDKIVAEADRLGYDAIIIPAQAKISKSSGGSNGKIKLLRAESIRDAVRIFANK